MGAMEELHGVSGTPSVVPAAMPARRRKGKKKRNAVVKDAPQTGQSHDALGSFLATEVCSHSSNAIFCV